MAGKKGAPTARKPAVSGSMVSDMASSGRGAATGQAHRADRRAGSGIAARAGARPHGAARESRSRQPRAEAPAFEDTELTQPAEEGRSARAAGRVTRLPRRPAARARRTESRADALPRGEDAGQNLPLADTATPDGQRWDEGTTTAQATQAPQAVAPASDDPTVPPAVEPAAKPDAAPVAAPAVPRVADVCRDASGALARGIDVEVLPFDFPPAVEAPADVPAAAPAPPARALDDEWPCDGAFGSPRDLRASGLAPWLEGPSMTLDEALAACPSPEDLTRMASPSGLPGSAAQADRPAARTSGQETSPEGDQKTSQDASARGGQDTRAAVVPEAGADASQGAVQASGGPDGADSVSPPAPQAAPAAMRRTGRVSRDGRRRNVAESAIPEELARRALATSPAVSQAPATPAPQAQAHPAVPDRITNVIELQEPKNAPSWAVALPAPANPRKEPSADGAVRRVLICWVGKVDVTAALRHDTVNPGPIRMLMERGETFDRAILLTTHGQASLEALRPWIGDIMDISHVEMRRTRVQDLTDHTLVLGAVMAAVEYAISSFGLPADGTGIWFHLSPGTPATHALLLLLATTRYRGIHLVQTKLPTPGQQVEVMEITVPDLGARASGEDKGPMAFGDVTPDIEVAEAALAERARAEREAQGAQDTAGTAEAGIAGARAGVAGLGALAGRSGRPSMPRQGIHAGRVGAYPGSAGRPLPYPAEGEPPLIAHALNAIYERFEALCDLPIPVLLLGESGCGRSQLARTLHEWSGRPGKFAAIDCAGLTDRSFLGELYGQKPDDYPGAWRSRDGAFRVAHQGTIFLQNVDALTPSQQAILLNALTPAQQSQGAGDNGTGEFIVQLPGPTPRQSTSARVRVIASAGMDLRGRIDSGDFRGALFHRLAGVTARLPAVREYALSERRTLLECLLARLQTKFSMAWTFDDDAWETLVRDEWPGNLRELSRTLQQICLTADPGPIRLQHVADQLARARVSLLPEERRLMAARQRAEALASLPELGEDRALPTDARLTECLRETAAPAGARGTAGSGPLSAMSLLQANIAQVDVVMDNGFGDGSYLEQERADAGNGGQGFVLGSGESIDAALDDLRRQSIKAALERADGNRAEAARLLGMTYSQLNYAVRAFQEND